MVGLMPVIQISGNVRVANDNQVYVMWWAVPFLWVFGILASMGVPIDRNCLVNFVRRHGVKIRRDQ